MAVAELNAPARDAQLNLAHSRLPITQEIYTHQDRQAQHDGPRQARRRPAE